MDPSPSSQVNLLDALSPEGPIIRIWVTRDGQIRLNGRGVGLEAVRAELEELARRSGSVCYGRDGAGEDPHLNAVRIIDMVLSNRLPIRLSMRSDFSDPVGPDGRND